MKHRMSVIVCSFLAAACCYTTGWAQMRPFSPEQITWTSKSHTFTQVEHDYEFTGDWERVCTHPGGNQEIWHYDLHATCTYVPVTGSYKEHLKVTAKSVFSDGVPQELPECLRNTQWVRTTSGELVDDPWLVYYPGMPFPGLHESSSRHMPSPCHYGAEFRNLDLPTPLSVHAFSAAEMQQLQGEAAYAPWPTCHPENSSAIPRIVSPQENQLFGSGRVQLYLEMSCRFPDYSKNAFFITLERRVSGPGVTPEVWQPEPIPGLQNNKVKMKPSLVPHELRAFGDPVVHLDFHEGYSLLRMKVKAIVWQDGGFQETNVQENWRHFRVGHPELSGHPGPGQMLPDLAVTSMSVMEDIMYNGKAAIRFEFDFKAGGKNGSSSIPVQIQCTKNQTPCTPGDLLLYEPNPVVRWIDGKAYAELWVVRPLEPTHFDFVVTVDPDDIISELREDNNEKQFTYQSKGYTPHARPTLRVTEPPSNAIWRPGSSHNVAWDAKLLSGHVRLWLISMKDDSRMALMPAPGVPVAGGSCQVTVPAGLPQGSYKLWAKSTEHPAVAVWGPEIKVLAPPQLGGSQGAGELHPPTPAGPGPIPPPTPHPSVNRGGGVPATLKLLELKSPAGMETWYIGGTYPIRWESTGIDGRIRIVLVARDGTKRTLNGMVGTDVKNKSFPWKIGPEIAPGSMYTIYLKTADGKVTSRPSGGFNIKKMTFHPNAGRR